MKKNLVLATVALTLCVFSFGQAFAENEDIKAELEQEIDNLYSHSMAKAKRAEKKKSKSYKLAQAQYDDSALEVQTVRPQQVQAAPQTAQPIVIMQQPVQQQPAQVHPPTTIEGQYVRETRTEQLRKQREEMERQNEDKLLQRLEDERNLAEKERGEKLFNNAQPVATPAPVVVVAPPPVEPVHVEPAIVSVKRAEIIDDAPKKEKAKLFVGGLGGVGNYPTVDNIGGGFAGGVRFGLNLPDGFILEAGYLYSNYDIKNPMPIYSGTTVINLITNMKQHNATAGLSYRPLASNLSPVVGVLAGYTRRDYVPKLSYAYTPTPVQSTGSNALDGGFLLGVDYKATDWLFVGVDARYLLNMTYRTDDSLAYSYAYQYGRTPVEDLSYFFGTIYAKFAF